ncbi:MAG: lysozyme [Rhodocyclaceae bacterium]|nr:lysozyme [Rhodocyclaceae bacterium]
MATKRTSPRGIKLIQESESFSAVIYLCPAGKPTIGYGHVVRPHDDLHPPISPAKALELLYHDLDAVEIYLSAVFPGLNQNQFDACADFCLNEGLKAFETSTLHDLLKAGAFAEAADEFPKWNKAHVNGQLVVLGGLTTRRQKERALFLLPDCDPAPTH